MDDNRRVVNIVISLAAVLLCMLLFFGSLEFFDSLFRSSGETTWSRLMNRGGDQWIVYQGQYLK